MQPQIYQSNKLKLYALWAGLILLFILGYLFYRSTLFHIVKTDPKLSGVSASSVVIKVYFNDELNGQSLVLDDPQKILSGSSVISKVLILKLSDSLTINKSYEVIIKNIENKDGDVITNKPLRFTAKDIPITKLSEDQQKAAINNQDKYPYDVHNITYTNFSDLTDSGISAGQLNNIKLALSDYSKVSGKKYLKMTVIDGSTVVTPHDSNSASMDNKARFTIRMGSDIYQVTVAYQGIYDAVHTVIKNNTGRTVYDSAEGHD